MHNVNPDWFNEFYAAAQSRLQEPLSRIFGDWHLVEDAIHDGCINFAKSQGDAANALKIDEALKRLFPIVKHRAIDLKRAACRNRERNNHDDFTFDQIEMERIKDDNNAERLVDALEALHSLGAELPVAACLLASGISLQSIQMVLDLEYGPKTLGNRFREFRK